VVQSAIPRWPLASIEVAPLACSYSADEVCSRTGRGCSETVDCALCDVETVVGGVFVDVAQDVGALHRSAEGGHLRLGFRVCAPEDACEHDPDRSPGALRIEFEVLFGADDNACDVVAHSLTELKKRGLGQLVTLGEIGQDARLIRVSRLTVRPRFDRVEVLCGLRSIVVYEVIQLAQDVIQAVNVAPDLGWK
jgi:hypothetical protein